MEQTKNSITTALTDFIKGGDENDIARLDDVLHEKFQNIQYGFFDKKGIYVIDKAGYLQLVKEKIFGGAERTISIQNLDILGNMAMVKVVLERKQLVFHSYIHLVTGDGNTWKVIGNYPHVEAR